MCTSKNETGENWGGAQKIGYIIRESVHIEKEERGGSTACSIETDHEIRLRTQMHFNLVLAGLFGFRGCAQKSSDIIRESVHIENETGEKWVHRNRVIL